MVKRAVIGMSGGVDSSAGAIILKELGYEVFGLSFTVGVENSDLKEAVELAQRLNINHKIVSVENEFKNKVVDYFLDGYRNCITPSPCLICNREIKFKTLYDYSEEVGAEIISTGHYSSFENINGYRYIKKGKSVKKDQSYMLYRLSDEIINKLFFPLAEMEKNEVRELLNINGINFFDKSESQGICFAKDGYEKYLYKYLGEEIKKGDIVDRKGNVVGEHKGVQLYTLGQRRGLGLDNGKAHFIVELDKLKNRVIIGEYNELLRKQVVIEKTIFHGEYIKKLKNGIDAIVRPRYSSSGLKARVYIRDENVIVDYEQENTQNAPGQHLVVYDGDIVAGGGIIGGIGF